MGHQQIMHIIGMLFFYGQNSFQHLSRPRIIVTEVTSEFAIVIYRDPLRDEVFLDHVDQILSSTVFGGSARSQSGGIEIRLAPELIDALGDLIHVLALFLGMLRELILDA